MGTLTVGISECRVSGEPSDVLATYALGSCVAVACYDPGAKVGGLLQVMLPTAIGGSARDLNPYMYADTGVHALLQALIEKGASKERLQVKLAGAAKMLASSLFDIGDMNVNEVRAALRAEGLSVLNSNLGGSAGIAMSLRIRDGQVTLRGIGRGEEIL